MTTQRLPTLAFVLLTVLGSGAHGADAEDLEDLLEARWFDIELVVFERLDVLDVNSSERLSLTAPRRWPENLSRFYDNPADAETVTIEPYDFDAVAIECLGYPELAEPDPLHPLLQPVTEFSDETLRAQAELEAALEAESAALEEATPEASAAQVEDLAEGEASADAFEGIVPQNAPAIVMTPYLQLLADVAAFEETLYAGAFQPNGERGLINEVKALNRQRHLRPLIHTRWRQPVPPRATPMPLYLSAVVDESAPMTESGFAKLEGFVSVTVGRYLHFAPTLWYHADTLGMQPIALPASAHSIPGASDSYMALEESRRMRSGELHYIDHPKIGVLVRIEPVAFPEPILEAWEALENSESTDGAPQ